MSSTTSNTAPTVFLFQSSTGINVVAYPVEVILIFKMHYFIKKTIKSNQEASDKDSETYKDIIQAHV